MIARHVPRALLVAAVALVGLSAPALATDVATRGCTIVGTSHRDVLRGTNGDDVICGLGGNDVIRGRGGNDVIRGGAGNDRLYGGDGNDTISGGAGKDRINGGPGADTIDCGKGKDKLVGVEASDTVTGCEGYVPPAPVDRAPTAVNDTKTVAEDSSATTIDVLANDTDADGGPKSIASATQPTHGTVVLTGSSGLTYKPDADYCGTDTFSYTLAPGGSTATVTVTVTCVNDAPVATAQSVTTDEDTPKVITLAGTDVDGDTLTYAIVAAPSHGSLNITATSVTYTPATNYHGPDSFTFTANDGTATSAPATVSITVTSVNDAPVATAQTVSTDEDTAKDFTLAGTDADQDDLTYALATQPSHGTLSGDAPDLTYTPAANYHGADSFTFTVNDGTVTSTAATVSITVASVNDAPVATAQTVSTDEDTAKNITLAGTDIDEDDLTYAVVGQPSHGTISGDAPDVTYTPHGNYNGPDSFTFTVDDGDATSAPATVSITVSSVNDAPVADNGTGSGDEDTEITLDLSASDVDGDKPLTFIAGSAEHGTLGTPSAASCAGFPSLCFGTVTYTPDPDWNGTDHVTYTVSDGSATSTAATITVTVNPVNDTPVAHDVAVTTNEDTSGSITLNGTDVDNDPLTYVVTANPQHGTLSGTAPNLTYTPSADYNGADSFTYKVNDGTVDSATGTVSITVNSVNDVPSFTKAGGDQTVAATQEGFTQTVAGWATDISAGPANESSQTVSFVVTSDDPHLFYGTPKVSSSGTLTYVPSGNAGTATVTVKAKDDGGTANGGVDTSAGKTFTITVTASTKPPVAVNDHATAPTGITINIPILNNDVAGSTPFSNGVVVTIVNGSTNGSTIVVDGTTIDYTSAASGGDEFTYTITDNNGLTSNVATVSMNTNSAPTAVDDSTETTAGDAVNFYVTVNDVDPDGALNPSTVSIVNPAAHGSLMVNSSNGRVTYTPTSASYCGPDLFTYTVNDNNGATSNTATVRLKVYCAD